MNALITTVEQLETDAAAAAEATVHVARLATSTGVGGGAASTAGAMRAASRSGVRRLSMASVDGGDLGTNAQER